MSSENEGIKLEEDKAISSAEEFVEQIEYGGRKAEGIAKYAIPLIAGGWSIFQLLLPQILLLNSEIVRSIHLGFAACLVFLCFPAIKSKRVISRIKNVKYLNFLYDKKLPVLDIIFAVLATLSALYLAFDYEGIGSRVGIPNKNDIIIGFILIILLLEAARRAVGPALPTIATIFMLYSFFSEYMPEVIAFKNASLDKLISKLTMGSEGIYGVPLDVSASTVFLFVLFGAILDKAGGGKYFIDLSFSLLGKYRGGPAKAAVLASGLTGMVSGSSIANTVTTGTFTIPLMKKTGFPAYKAAAVEVATSTNGQLMPPIMGAAAFIIAEYCNLSYIEVIKTALIPAFVSYIALLYIVHLESKKLNLQPIGKEHLPKFFKTLVEGIHFIIPILFLLHQLVIMRRSAQTAVYYAIISLLVLILVKNIINKKEKIKEALILTCHQIWDSLVVGAKNMMNIGVAVAVAGIIVGVVTLGLGNVVIEVIDKISGGNLIIMLFVTAFISLLLGLGLPTTANYIIMASLTAPAIIALSGDAGMVVPLIAAHLFCFYFGILADDTPPVGLAAYAAAAIAKEDPIKTGIQGFRYDMRTAILPFMFIFNTELLLIGVESYAYGVVVFVTALIAMFAFASFTQGHMFIKNKWYEGICLLMVMACLFRPDFLGNRFDIHLLGLASRHSWQIVGVTLFFACYFYQRLRSKRA